MLTNWLFRHIAAPATREEMSAAKLPLAYRDGCANLLIPLNRCRVDTYYLPWKCEVCGGFFLLSSGLGLGRDGARI